jgi:hypothetical protein
MSVKQKRQMWQMWNYQEQAIHHHQHQGIHHQHLQSLQSWKGVATSLLSQLLIFKISSSFQNIKTSQEIRIVRLELKFLYKQCYQLSPLPTLVERKIIKLPEH